MKESIQKFLSLLTNGGGSDLNTTPIASLLLKGGLIMIPIIILSIVAVYIIIYKVIEFANTSKYPDLWILNLKNNLIEGDVKKVKQLCKQRSGTLLSKVVIRLVEKLRDKNIKDISNLVEAEGKDIVYKLETKISTLGVISGVAPMLGFLGTVTGLIQSFIKIAQSKSQVNPAVLSGGIYEAMVTTAAGLAVGIIAYLGYNYMIIRIQKATHKLEYRLSEIMDSLQEFRSKI